jgi:hypothetical protein
MEKEEILEIIYEESKMMGKDFIIFNQLLYCETKTFKEANKHKRKSKNTE